MVMTILRWMGVAEAEMRMVDAFYIKIKGRVVVGLGMSEKFLVNNSLRQGSA